MKPLLLIIAVCLAACTPGTLLNPEVSVSIEDFTQYGDENGKVGRIVLRLHNRAEIPVHSASLSLELQTDFQHYFTTVHDDRGIPPGMRVFIVVEFLYLSPDEHATIDGVTLTDSFFI